jgi:hypothetical protein
MGVCMNWGHVKVNRYVMSEKGTRVFSVVLLSLHMDCYFEKFSLDTKDAH